ncbi:MAG TPA: hypothetical protein VGL83_18560 [Stellaceae bacterium]|jgi:hypothetical protein
MAQIKAGSRSDRLYTINFLKRQARSARLEAARAAATLSAQLVALAANFEAEAAQLEQGRTLQA